MRGDRRLRAGCLVLACSGFASCGGDASPSDDTGVIRIGAYLQQGGDGAEELLAVREINAAGGLTIGGKDYRLELVRVQDGESAAGGVAATQELLQQEVVAATAPRWSSIVLGEREDHGDGVARAAIDEGLLLVCGSATSAAITTLEDDDLIWRTIPSDNYQGVAIASYAYQESGARRATILYRDDAWGRGLADTFTRAFQELGGEVLAQVGYDAERDLDGYAFPELEGIFLEQADSIFIAAFEEFSQISNRIVQGRHLQRYPAGLPQLLAADGTYDTDILTNAAPEVLALLAGTVPGPSKESVGYTTFLDAFIAAGFNDPDQASAYAYDAVYLIALAMQAADSIDPRDFAASMHDVSIADPADATIEVGQWADAKQALLEGRGVDYQGASGAIDFTEQGDPSVARYSIWTVEGDAASGFHFEESVGVEFRVE